MNWDIAEGNWKQFRGKVKTRWSKLTDDHLDVISGKRIQLAGKLQEIYSITQNEAERQIRSFEKIQQAISSSGKPHLANPGEVLRSGLLPPESASVDSDFQPA